MSETISLKLPWPPTANTYYRHVGAKVLLSRSGRDYREAVQALLAGGFEPLAGRVRVTLSCHAPDNRRRDLDNLTKGLLDSLTHAKIWNDDSQIDDLRIIRMPAIKGGTVLVEVEEC